MSAVDRLESSDVGSPRMNAEVLLMFVLGINRAYLYAHPERELTAEEESRYAEVLSQRATGMPSQYIMGHQEFWGLDFIVSPAVLIRGPRPNTWLRRYWRWRETFLILRSWTSEPAPAVLRWRSRMS